MNDKSFEQIKNLIAVFRLLATKVQKDNQTKTKNLKEANQVLEACRKEYQKLHHENETLKKTIKQQEELQKYQDQLKNQPTCADGKKIIITLKDIEFDEDKPKKIFATQKKEKRHYGFDYYSDETDIESEDEPTDNDDSNDKIVIREEKKTLKRKTQEHLLPKSRRKNRKVSWAI